MKPMDTVTDWVITLPKQVEWEDYEKELKSVEDFSADMFFRVPKFCRSPRSGDRCFVLHRGRIIGWMRVTGLVTVTRGWNCETTGRLWPAGRYLMRSGPFSYSEQPMVMQHFRGIRRFHNGEFIERRTDNGKSKTC